ncbi:type II secretion system F family protein [Patescibacteria group bacterium]|nr:type II secretion system F family protein [Patescibacteria group bacterium]
MPQFSYTVSDQKGKTIKGLIEASNEKSAANILHGRGFTIIDIESAKKGIQLPYFGGVNIAALSQFTRQLATMISSGLPLADSLVVLSKQTENKKLVEIIKQISDEIEGGKSFSSALSKHSSIFSGAYISVIQAGEASGTLDQVLQKLAITQEKEREFSGKVKGALIYPAVIMIAMGGVMAIILIFVVPKLSEVYVDLGITLPLPTRILIGLSGFMVKFWWLVIILGVVGFMAFSRYRKTPEGALLVDKILIKLPVIGKLNRDSSLTTFTRTLGSLVAAGVPIIDSLKISGKTATMAVHRVALERVATLVEKGTTLSKALEKEESFPPIISQMANVGEETGKMDEVLSKVSIYFEQEVDQQVKNLTTALEPIIMIILGVMVGALMVSIVLPIYSITSAF